MTSTEWELSTDPVEMLSNVPDLVRTERKFNLFLVACCRANWELLPHRDSRAGVEWVERFADGLTTRDAEFFRVEDKSEGGAIQCEQVARTKVRNEWGDNWEVGTDETVERLAGRHDESGPSEASQLLVHAAYFANDIMGPHWQPTDQEVSPRLRKFLSAPHLRDIFGNPFRPVSFDPSWLTSTVLLLAQGIYAEKAYDRMPILADCLMDEGCNNEDILNHLRGPGPHSKGCWAIDMMLGKT